MIKLVVVGNGMVGYKFCEKFVTKKGSENYQITVFGEEPRRAYDRVHLSEYFAGKVPMTCLCPQPIGMLTTILF